MTQADTVSGSPPPHPLVAALASGESATEVLSRAVGSALALRVVRQGARPLTPEVFALLGNPDTVVPYHREGELVARTGPHAGRVVAVVTASVLLHRLPPATSGAVLEGLRPLGTLLAPLGAWRRSWGVRVLADPVPGDDTPAFGSSATLFLGAVPVAYVTEEIPGWVASLPDPRLVREAAGDLRQVLLAAVLAQVGGGVVVSPATLATAARTGRIEVEPDPGGGMAVRFVSEPPTPPGNRRSHPDRVGDGTEAGEP